MATDLTSPDTEPSYTQPTVDVPTLTTLLDGRYAEVRASFARAKKAAH